MGLRHGEIQGLLWENYQDGEIYVSRSIWNGCATDPKTRKGRAPVPVIRQLAERLDMHRLQAGNPASGPIFMSSAGTPVCLHNTVTRVILPALNRCEICGKPDSDHRKADHAFKRDASIPEWHGWHAARRGLGSNLYRLGVPEKVIQQILREVSVEVPNVCPSASDIRAGQGRAPRNNRRPCATQRSTLACPAGVGMRWPQERQA